uniref:Secreted protein n=1 Tax=Sus scrofa TaxID=9823 RepID=A0A4X1T5W7_PIG
MKKKRTAGVSFFCLFRATPVAYGGSQARVYTTATAMPDPSHVCNLHHSSWRHQILHALSEARDRTCNLIVPSRIRFHCATTGTPCFFFKVGFLAFCGVGHGPLGTSFFFFFFAFSRAIPVSYGGSQARGLIGAVATDLCQSHSNVGSESCL